MLLTKMRPEFCLGCAPGYHEAPAQSASSLLRLLLSSGVNTAHQLLAKHSSFPTRNITRRYKFRENRSWLISRKTRLLWALLLLLLFSFLCLCVCVFYSPRGLGYRKLIQRFSRPGGRHKSHRSALDAPQHSSDARTLSPKHTSCYLLYSLLSAVSYKQQRPIHSGSRTCTEESSGAKRRTRKHDGDDSTHHSLLPPPLPRELTTTKWAKAGGLGRTAATETPLVLQGASATRLGHLSSSRGRARRD